MARGIPRGSSKSDVAPLTVKRLTNVPIVAIGAFRAIQEKEDRRTKEKYEVEQVKLSIDFDSGHIMRNADGEPVLDNDGNEQPFFINEGFVTLSGNEKAKLVEILKAVGFDGPEFIVQEGKDAGALTAAAAESLVAEFGVNGLGDDYSGQDWEDLPLYVLERDGGKHRKRDVEVPVMSLRILGHEVIGRRCDLALEIKNGYNRVSAFLPPVDPEPLGKAKPKSAKPKRAPARPVEEEDDEAPFDTGPARTSTVEMPRPETKHARYALARLVEANVPVPFMAQVVRALTGTTIEDWVRFEDMPLDVGQNFRDMVKANPDAIAQALEHVMSGTNEEADSLDDEEDF